jgi:hypothetical protein
MYKKEYSFIDDLMGGIPGANEFTFCRGGTDTVLDYNLAKGARY